MMPALPAAHLVLVQPSLTLVGLKLGLDGPAHRSHSAQCQQASIRRSIGTGRTSTPSHPDCVADQPALPSRQASRALPDPSGHKLVSPRALRALCDRVKPANPQAQAGGQGLPRSGLASSSHQTGSGGLAPLSRPGRHRTLRRCVKTVVVQAISSTYHQPSASRRSRKVNTLP